MDTPPHDKNRVIVDGHWLPEALLYLAVVAYDAWGYSGLKAVLHHNLLDYAHTLATGGKYGWLAKYYGPQYAIVDVERLVRRVLDNIERDFSKPFNALRSGTDPYDVVREVAGSWFSGVEYPDELANIFRRGDAVKLLEELLRAVNELRDCIYSCVLEVVELVFHSQNRFKDVCPVCFSPIHSAEEYLRIPVEYVRKDLAYRVHRRCFEQLKNRARELLREGLSIREVLRRLPEKFMPPSIVCEAVKDSSKQVECWQTQNTTALT